MSTGAEGWTPELPPQPLPARGQPLTRAGPVLAGIPSVCERAEEIPGSGGLAERGLSLGTASHRSLHAAPGNGIRQKTFVSAPDEVLVHRLRSESPTDVILRLQTPLRQAHCTSEPSCICPRSTRPSRSMPTSGSLGRWLKCSYKATQRGSEYCRRCRRSWPQEG
ncbi:glycoside hydrolase N-terminal domain-containing protein [Arthrobacter sp. SLBN-100]|uniref:glycoside hydrolase N-terminal domain-containing protein n=1 Tax=Arthrobacter sp. SLBN-100 TaxID=2768450 RepID=UPI003FA4152D